MAFRKLERSSQTPPGWRLATVKEAMENLELIKHNHLLEEWDRVRLLDGWIGGRGYDFNVEVGFRSCLGYMLLVQSPTPEISNADDRKAILYSTVPKLGKEGRNAAVFLCAEDWNEEILYSLMPGEYYATREGDETRLTSEVVSAMAREWQGVFNARNRALKMELVPLTSLEDLRISIEESLKALVVDTEKALSSLIIKNQSSERGTIANDILKELFSLISQFDLTEYFKMFEDIGQHVVAETVWSVVVETMASETFYILCSQLNRNVVIDSDPSLTDLVQYSYAFLGETQREVRKVVEAAAREADGDFKRFEEILRDQWFPMLSCRSKPDALSTCLLRAAYHGDVNMVKELIELGVQPSAKDVVSGDSGETALHFAVNHGDRYTEDESFKIADMLLAKDRSLANAVDWEERTPLLQAASHGDARMCTLLLEHNASLSAKDAKGWTPLHHALSVSSYHEVVRVLLSEEGKDSIEGSARLVDAANNDGETPLDYAIANTDNDVSSVALLLSESSQAESYFEMLRQPLSAYLRESSRMGYENLVQKLVDGGGDPFEEDDQGKTPLHYAAEGTNEHVAFGIIQKLLFDKKQGTVNWGKASAGDKYGRNVLHVAAFLGNKSLCSELLRVNSNLIATKDRDGQSAIYYAVAGDHDNPHVFDELISSEGDRTNVVSIKDFSQTTLLHVAATAGNRKMVKRLLSGISRQDRKSYVGSNSTA